MQPQPRVSPIKITENPDAYDCLDVVLAKIYNQDSSACLAALKELDELIKDHEKVQLLGQRMDQLLTSCYMQYRHILNTKLKTDNSNSNNNPDNNNETMRLLQYLSMVLMSTYHHADLVKGATWAPLHDLLQMIIGVLLEPATGRLPQGEQLIRTLNVLVVKIIERSEHTQVNTVFPYKVCTVSAAYTGELGTGHFLRYKRKSGLSDYGLSGGHCNVI